MDALVEAGCVPAIIKAAWVHREHAELQKCGCFALAALAHTHPPSQSLILASGGVAVLTTAMRQHDVHEPVQRWALRALQNLATDHSSNADAIAAAGGTELARAAVQAHSIARYVRLYAGALLELLADADPDRCNAGRWQLCTPSSQLMANPVPADWVEAVTEDGMTLHWAPEPTASNKDVVLAALTQNHNVLSCGVIPATLLQHPALQYISGINPGLEATHRRLCWAYTLLPDRAPVAANLPVELVELVGRHTTKAVVIRTHVARLGYYE
jgi:hypothetical protein